MEQDREWPVAASFDQQFFNQALCSAPPRLLLEFDTALARGFVWGGADQDFRIDHRVPRFEWRRHRVIANVLPICGEQWIGSRCRFHVPAIDDTTPGGTAASTARK